MSRLPHLLILALICCCCAGNSFDEATIPTDQHYAELAFKRVAVHGALEPVLEDGQTIEAWQFHTSALSRVAVMNGEPEITYQLKDRSGIDYQVNSKSTALDVIEQLQIGSYGYATGKIVSVKRDLPAGVIEAELSIDSWRKREP